MTTTRSNNPYTTIQRFLITQTNPMIGFGHLIYPQLTSKTYYGTHARDALPTKLRLNRFVSRVPSRCVLYDNTDEDFNHFFFDCTFMLKSIHHAKEFKLFHHYNNIAFLALFSTTLLLIENPSTILISCVS